MNPGLALIQPMMRWPTTMVKEPLMVVHPPDLVDAVIEILHVCPGYNSIDAEGRLGLPKGKLRSLFKHLVEDGRIVKAKVVDPAGRAQNGYRLASGTVPKVNSVASYLRSKGVPEPRMKEKKGV
jgi:hypothetical protein